MLAKIIAILVLPPVSLLLLAALGTLMARRWWGKGLLILSLLSLWLLALSPVRDMLSRPLEYADPALNIADALPHDAAIVVPGGGLYERAPEYQGQNLPSDDGLHRVLLAADLSLQHGLPIYASGGVTMMTASEESEAAVIRRWLLRFGVADALIHLEASSRTTMENARYIAAQLKAAGIQRVVLVTNAWHMPRARWCFEQQGLQVIAAPTAYITQQTPYSIRDFLPSTGVLDDSRKALHEYLGLLWYRWLYHDGASSSA